MSVTVKHFRIRLLILVTLIAACLSLASGPEAVACEKCVFPTGGICVGCMVAERGEQGYNSCVPDQSSCTCQVGGGGCELPIGP